jgi:hypothetical protein
VALVVDEIRALEVRIATIDRQLAHVARTPSRSVCNRFPAWGC